MLKIKDKVNQKTENLNDTDNKRKRNRILRH